jgi:uncharacterized membrane protein
MMARTIPSNHHKEHDMDYILQAASAWFVGFFPLAEIYVAVPYGMAIGLDDVSVIVWTVFGNFTPALLIGALYQQMMRVPRIANWLSRLVSEKAQERVNRWGIWFVLIATTWTGIWAMALTAKILGMKSSRFLPAAFISILVVALLTMAGIQAGGSLLG